MSFSLKLTNLDDFISPSQACVKPLIGTSDASKAEGAAVSISLEDDGSYVQIHSSGTKTTLSKAEISLNDCLACSGCVTSAETVLITAQSLTQFRAAIQDVLAHPPGTKLIVVSLSPQSRASIAHHFSLSLADAHARLVSFFQRHAADARTVDVSFARTVSLLETYHEFAARQRGLPCLSSACPGWICYAEKRHGAYILPLISTAKSPQQVLGTVVKSYWARQLGLDPSAVFHVAVMPCYDKKLEATRPDFQDPASGMRQVDCVLTTGEILDFIAECEVEDLASLPPAPALHLHPLTSFREDSPVSNPGGSGGYAEFVYRQAARTLHQRPLADDAAVPWVVSRNKDMQTAVLKDPRSGRQLLKVALVYGFRNIQTIVRQIKSKRCDIDFAEVMACPSGCLNGGGQIKPSSSDSTSTSASTSTSTTSTSNLIQHLSELYHSQINVFPSLSPEGPIAHIYQLSLIHI